LGKPSHILMYLPTARLLPPLPHPPRGAPHNTTTAPPLPQGTQPATRLRTGPTTGVWRERFQAGRQGDACRCQVSAITLHSSATSRRAVRITATTSVCEQRWAAGQNQGDGARCLASAALPHLLCTPPPHHHLPLAPPCLADHVAVPVRVTALYLGNIMLIGHLPASTSTPALLPLTACLVVGQPGRAGR